MEGWFCTRCWQRLEDDAVANNARENCEQHRYCGGRALPIEVARKRLRCLLDTLAEDACEPEDDPESEDVDQHSWPQARIRNPRGTY